MTLQQREQGRGDTRQQAVCVAPPGGCRPHKHAQPHPPWKRFMAITTRPTILNLPWVLLDGWASASAPSPAVVLALLLGLSSCAAGRSLDTLSTSTMLLAAGWSEAAGTKEMS